MFLYPAPKKLLVCVLGWGLKTETGKLHEILTNNFLGFKNFYTPQIVSVCFVEEGLKLKLADCIKNNQHEKANISETVSKTNYIKLNLPTPNVHKALYGPWNE